jgi:VIT1/CCC1 family predicted Fe2+/Mn2+ transporter
MLTSPGRRDLRFLRSLDPAESLGEILFGLIMVLTFTLGAGIAVRTGEGEGSAGELLYAAIGCNIAWGIIDAALYVMGNMFIRSRRSRLIRAMKAAPDQAAALAAIRSELEPGLESISQEEDRDRLYRSIQALIARSEPARTRLTRDDLIGAVAVFILVFATALPAAAPFLVIGDPWLALRLSNLILIALLFIAGYRWAGYTNANPWLAGLGVMILGVSMVAIAIPLGG